MNANTLTDTNVETKKSWPDYRAVWRWHFYAGLLCIPFVIILSITGGIYLFKPQIEAWNERAFDNLTNQGTSRSAAEQIRAALAAVPDSTLNGYELPQGENRAARVIVKQKGVNIRAYVHPQTLEVLHTFPENDRFMRFMFRIHGELLMGDRGSMIVELAASWTIIMILTGLYLWWPRQSKGLGGILYPRLSAGSRIFWRDIHSVTGVWISALAMFLLLSGLPWAKSWGNYLKAVRSLTNTAVAKQEWSNTSEGEEANPAKSAKGSAGEGGEHSGHGGHGGGSGRSRGASRALSQSELAAVDKIVASVRPLELAHPVVIAPPPRDSTHWTVKSMTANRPYRENLVVDAESGKVISRDGFREKQLIDQIVSVGIAAHEGQLFGWPNQVLGLLTALGLLLLSFSGLVLWWQRRDQGVLGAPKAILNPRVSLGLLAIVILLGVYLPLFGTTLIAVLLLERIILCRIPPVRNWLGLQSPGMPLAGGLMTLNLLTITFAGCRGPQPITGGTPGMLRSGNEQLAEMQITLHQFENGTLRPVGFAVTGMDGSFELVTNEAKGALKLPSGLYRCTLESAGSPVRIPPVLARPETTPLLVTWNANDGSLNLDVQQQLGPGR